jgi:phosphatidylglycerophosphate synthase
VSAQGLHLEPSILGKWKATAQFIALALVMVRPDVVIAGAFLDQWLLGVAALITVWSGVDYFVRFWSAFRAPP